jgi:signal transduction histidine kinase
MDENSKLQKIHASNTRLVAIVTLLAIVFGITALTFSFLSYRTMYRVQKANENRYQSYRLIDQLRLSSDQLTLMARSYVVTGNKKFLQFYDEIAAIRNGVKPWPALEQRIYWQLLMPDNGASAVADGREKTLKELLSEFGFSEPEMDLLHRGQEESRRLSLLEMKAFAVAQQALDRDLDYQQSEQRLAALALLYSNDYLLEKAKMMSLMNEFLEIYESRSVEEMESLQQQLYWMVNLAIFSFLLLVLLLIYSMYTRTHEKELFVKTLHKEVANRTLQLFQKREEVKAALNEMRATQAQLVEAEKMALLGNLVAGVAHEVNTPLGLSVTLASHLQDENNQLMKKIASGQLKRSELETYCDESTENCRILLSNLQRAANLIRSFKQVAVDQGSEELRAFKISEYLQELLLSLHPKFKKTQVEVQVAPPENEVEVQTYPGAFAQIVSNIAMNALIHAFDNGQRSGLLLFSLEYEKESVKLKVEDNGKGMEKEVCDKIFEPFFTTTRGSGGSGLGMSIVYNLVVHQLHGSISCQSTVDKGTTFLLQFPIRIESGSLRG